MHGCIVAPGGALNLCARQREAALAPDNSQAIAKPSARYDAAGGRLGAWQRWNRRGANTISAFSPNLEKTCLGMYESSGAAPCS